MEYKRKERSIYSPESVISGLSTLYCSPYLSDFTIVLKESNERIPSHSQILGVSSSYFSSMINGPYVEGSSKELFLSDIDPDIFKIVLRFIYTGEAKFPSESIVKIIEAASRFCIPEAIKQFTKAAQSIINDLDVSESSILAITMILCESVFYKLEEVSEMCFEYIDLNTKAYLESEAFLELSSDIIALILTRNTLYDGLQEVSLYLACLRWARGFGDLDEKNHENFETKSIPEDKKEDLKDLIVFIRLPLIEAKFIINYIEKSELFAKEQLYVAMAYQASPESFINDQSNCFRERIGSKKPWHWSEEKIGAHILLSNDKLMAIAHHYDWEKVMGNTIWHAGVHRFKVQLELNTAASSNSWQIIVGVCSPSALLTEHLGSGAKEWGLACFSGHKISCGDKREDYTQGSKKGDIIEVSVDLATKKMEFFKDGLSLGVAFKNVTSPITPAVSLLKGQRVKLIWD